MQHICGSCACLHCQKAAGGCKLDGEFGKTIKRCKRCHRSSCGPAQTYQRKKKTRREVCAELSASSSSNVSSTTDTLENSNNTPHTVENSTFREERLFSKIATTLRLQLQAEDISYMTSLQAGGRCVVIVLDRRAEEDRARKTIDSCMGTLGTLCSMYQYAGVNGRGSIGGGEPTPMNIDIENRNAALSSLQDRLNGTMGDFLTSAAGLLPDKKWIMSNDDFTSKCPHECYMDQAPAYTSAMSGGTVGCAASHFHVACMLAAMPDKACPYYIVVENDVRLVRGPMRAILDCLGTIKVSWDIVLLYRGTAGPMVDNYAYTEETVLSERTQGKEKFSLNWASYVAGQNAYLLSRRGATKIANSGFHKEIFCYDDFLNLVNSRRRGAHFHGELDKLQSVETTRQMGGGLSIIVCSGVKIVGHDSASRTSDTLYARPIAQ
jgi:GR25 family glycosyltransferase involved in LPS biosynthesis